MTWIKLNDNSPRHPKVAGLSDKAFRVWILGMCYASEFLTDGLLPVSFLVTIPRKSQDELIKAGLWVYDGEIMIHDYLQHQTSKEVIAKKKAVTAERVARYRASRNAGSNAVTNAPVTHPENREQIQRADTENRDLKEQVRADGFEAWWAAYPKKTGKGAALKAWMKIHPSGEKVSLMMSALTWQTKDPQWTKDGGAYIPNPATYLNQSRWEDEPFFQTTTSHSPKPVVLTRLASLGMDRENR